MQNPNGLWRTHIESCSYTFCPWKISVKLVCFRGQVRCNFTIQNFMMLRTKIILSEMANSFALSFSKNKCHYNILAYLSWGKQSRMVLVRLWVHQLMVYLIVATERMIIFLVMMMMAMIIMIMMTDDDLDHDNDWQWWLIVMMIMMMMMIMMIMMITDDYWWLLMITDDYWWCW